MFLYINSWGSWIFQILLRNKLNNILCWETKFSRDIGRIRSFECKESVLWGPWQSIGAVCLTLGGREYSTLIYSKICVMVAQEEKVIKIMRLQHEYFRTSYENLPIMFPLIQRCVWFIQWGLAGSSGSVISIRPLQLLWRRCVCVAECFPAVFLSLKEELSGRCRRSLVPTSLPPQCEAEPFAV